MLMKVYTLRSRLEHCNGEWLWETDSIPIHQCVWICFQNGNGNKNLLVWKPNPTLTWILIPLVYMIL